MSLLCEATLQFRHYFNNTQDLKLSKTSTVRDLRRGLYQGGRLFGANFLGGDLSVGELSGRICCPGRCVVCGASSSGDQLSGGRLICGRNVLNSFAATLAACMPWLCATPWPKASVLSHVLSAWTASIYFANRSLFNVYWVFGVLVFCVFWWDKLLYTQFLLFVLFCLFSCNSESFCHVLSFLYMRVLYIIIQ